MPVVTAGQGHGTTWRTTTPLVIMSLVPTGMGRCVGSGRVPVNPFDSWFGFRLALESNPEVLNTFACKIGLAPGMEFIDVLAPELLPADVGNP